MNHEHPPLCGAVMTVMGAMGIPRDPHGCRLPSSHDGPHECVDPHGRTWNWETDWECDCEHCQECDGDYCIIYWEAHDPQLPLPLPLVAQAY